MKTQNLHFVLFALFINAYATYAMGGEIQISDPSSGQKLFTDALNAKDTDTLLALYADDAVMVVPGNKHIKGKAAIRQFFEEIVPSVNHINLETVFRVNHQNTVLSRSKYTVVYKTTEGEMVSQSSSGIEVLEKQDDGSWLFTVDHHYGGAELADFQKLDYPE